MTVVGGMRSVEDVRQALRSGADKVGINTKAIADPQFIRHAAETFGSQCITLSVEAKCIVPGKWEAYTDNGRERTGRDALEWVEEGIALGAGEVLLTSVDREGTKKGYDVQLVKSVYNLVDVPVIASGGAGEIEHLLALAAPARVDGLAVASILHTNTVDLVTIKKGLLEGGAIIRP